MLSPPRPGRTDADRLAAYEAVSTSLALLGDRQLGALVDASPPVAAGIGGTAVAMDVDGVPVFAKRVPLTDRELHADNVRSTADVFGLPTGCQYGIGRSPGAGAWRELAANAMTTNWVLAGRAAGFPLMYHWRVLPGTAPMPAELADIDSLVASWDGSAAVRGRLEGLAGSTAGVVMFLEYVPQTLDDWFTTRMVVGEAAIEQACALVERQLTATVAFMNANGLTHFDAHFRNILTDGERLYLTDLGLATSPRFALSDAEAAFLAQHRDHDAGYAVTELVNGLLVALTGVVDRAGCLDRIRRCVADGGLPGMPPAAATVVIRHAPVALVMNAFYSGLHRERRIAPFPSADLHRALADTRRSPATGGRTG